MKWPVVVIVAYLMLGLELAIKPILAIGPPGEADVAPSFLIPFIVFIALSAPVIPTLWVALLLGLAVDITPRADGTYIVLGPYAIGYMAAAYLTLTMRGLMIRRNPLSLMFLSVVSGALAELIVVAFFSLRVTMYGSADMGGWSAGNQLVHRLLGVLYTLATALALAIILIPINGLFGFQDIQSRRFGARRG